LNFGLQKGNCWPQPNARARPAEYGGPDPHKKGLQDTRLSCKPFFALLEAAFGFAAQHKGFVEC